MARIKTQEALKEYIKTSMGAPSIRIELTDDQLNICIDKAIEIYAEFGYDGMKTQTLLVNLTKGVNKYYLPDNVMAVTGLQALNTYSSFINIPAGYTLAMNPITLNMLDSVSNIDIQAMTAKMAQMSTLRNIFDISINFDFNFNSKELTFFEPPVSSTVLLELGVEYEPNPIDNIYNNMWIKQRAIGEAYLMWSGVVGKYSSQLVNGSEINYADIQAKGEAIIEKSNEDLEEQFEPLGIYVF